MMKHPQCEICQATPRDLILETVHWTVSLSNDARYPGRCYITLNDHRASLAELSSEEWSDFELVVQKLEKAAKTAFGASLCNWTCLMNNAFQQEPSYPHVHWHFRPRYKNTVKIGGKEYKDREFGLHYKSAWAGPAPKLSESELQEIAQRYKAALE